MKLSALSGYRTYLTAGVAVALLIGQSRGWWTLPPEVYGATGFVALGFLRASMARPAATPPGATGTTTTVP